MNLPPVFDPIAPASPGAAPPDGLKARPAWLRYGVAVAAVAVAALATWGLSALVQPLLVTPLFFAGVAVAAWFGGTGPALLAIALSAALLERYFLAGGVGTRAEVADLVALVTVCFVGLLIARLSTARARSEAELVRRVAAKDRFLATLSHELRTPLTPVLARVSALERDRTLAPELRRQLAMMRRNVELEARLIDDLLDLTRITRGKLEVRREVVDMAPLLEHVVEICGGEAGGAAGAGRPAVELRFEGKDHRVWGDRSRLTQVFWNLLSNALKFTPPEGTISIRTRIRDRIREGGGGEREPGEIEIEVADTGIGFDPGRGELLFQPFEQADRGITRRFGGLGLGLALTRTIVEMHGGTIAAASAGPGRGATFTVRLPQEGLPEATPVPPSELRAADLHARPAAGNALHILLVEDHADTAEAMAGLLEAQGYRVTVAGSLAEARAALARGSADGESDPPRLLISDLGLPDGSGLELMEELGGRLPLAGIALSGYGMEEDVRRSREAGFREHLTKPVTLNTLLAAVRRAEQGRDPAASA